VEKSGASLERIKDVLHLSEDENYLFARSLAASPDEKWQLHQSFLRAHDFFTGSARKKHGFKS
jgi:hypothetical protein